MAFTEIFANVPNESQRISIVNGYTPFGPQKFIEIRFSESVRLTDIPKPIRKVVEMKVVGQFEIYFFGHRSAIRFQAAPATSNTASHARANVT